MNITIRLAEINELELIEALMKRSMKILGEGYYSKDQIDSCCQFVCVPDRQLIEDKTLLDEHNIQKIVIKVFSAPGQSGSATWVRS